MVKFVKASKKTMENVHNINLDKRNSAASTC